MRSVTIKGLYGNGPAAVVVHRHPPAQMVQIQCSHPSVLLDAAGHHELLQALAFPPAQPATPRAADAVEDRGIPTSECCDVEILSGLCSQCGEGAVGIYPGEEEPSAEVGK